MRKHKTDQHETYDEPTMPHDDQLEDDDNLVVHSIDDASDVLPMGDDSELRAQLNEAIAARQRAQADFLNFQRRSMENEQRARREGIATIARSMMGIIDHFDLALEQPVEMTTTEQLMDGLRMVRGELLRSLDQHGVKVIQPEPGDPFDPEHQQAVLRMPTDEFAPNMIAQVLQLGFVLDTTVLRPANVVVAAAMEGAPADAAHDDAGDEDDPHADV